MSQTLIIDTESDAGAWLRAAKDAGIEIQEYRPRTSLKADSLSGLEGWPPAGTSDDGQAEKHRPLRMASNQAFSFDASGLGLRAGGSDGFGGVKRRTQKQNDATMRNWGIRSLRGFYGLSYQLEIERGERVRAIVDEELAARGAETEAARRDRQNSELMETANA